MSYIHSPFYNLWDKLHDKCDKKYRKICDYLFWKKIDPESNLTE